jgi:methionyl aminopeptidase
VIILKTDLEIDAMRAAGHLAFELLEALETFVVPGISTLDINDFVHAYTLRKGAISAPLGYRGFPKSVCTSLNEVVCHGIPNKRHILKDGDIINVDVTPILNGYHGDSSRTYLVGKGVSPNARKLVDCARECLRLGIAEVFDGCRVGSIGHAIQTYAEGLGFSVVREFIGHGIGKTFHEDPEIPHYGQRDRGPRLTKGMVFTIEPMINEGAWPCKILPDKWTAVTADNKLSAQFEHTLAIRSDGRVEVLTDPNLGV